MSNEINQKELVEMLKETANFCRDAKQIFNNLCLELGNKNLIKSKDAIYESFFFTKGDWICYDFYFESNNTINGFRLIIATENTDRDERYKQIVKHLDIDEKIPILLIYGCFNPVQNIQKSTETTVSMMDICCGLTVKKDEEYFWINFNENQIAPNKEILVEMKEWTPEIAKENEYVDWENSFFKAKIKYKPLLELRNSEDLKRLADEIRAMAF